MFVAMQGVIIEGDVFAFLVQEQATGRGKALREGWFIPKLMRELSRLQHGLSVDPRGAG